MCATIGLVLVKGSEQLKKMADETSGLLAERDISTEKIRLLQNAKNDTDQLEEITQLLDRLLPATKDQEKLIADVIYTATSQAGIPQSSISNFTFSGNGLPDALSGTEKSTIASDIYEYPFSLQLSKLSYATLIQLLAEIESNGRLVQVDNVQITPDETNSALLSVNLSMKAYVKP